MEKVVPMGMESYIDFLALTVKNDNTAPLFKVYMPSILSNLKNHYMHLMK